MPVLINLNKDVRFSVIILSAPPLSIGFIKLNMDSITKGGRESIWFDIIQHVNITSSIVHMSHLYSIALRRDTAL